MIEPAGDAVLQCIAPMPERPDGFAAGHVSSMSVAFAAAAFALC
jgi:hypothetical protein